MMIFLILAPYGAFATLMLLTSPAVSLFVSAAICLAVIAYDVLAGRSVKLLGTGSAILFAALGGYLALGDSVAFGFDPLVRDFSEAENFIGYPEALAALLDVEVANASCPGEASGGFISLTSPLDTGCRPCQTRPGVGDGGVHGHTVRPLEAVLHVPDLLGDRGKRY